MTLTIIILSIMLIAAIALIVYGSIVNTKLRIENKQHVYVKELYNRHEHDFKACYTIFKGVPGCANRIGVYRMSIQNGRTFMSLIKVFTDWDESYNYREAEELVEKLNEK